MAEKTRQKNNSSSYCISRNSASTNGVMNDEFVIYDKNQAKVEYIVYYRPSNFNRYSNTVIP